MGAPMPLLRRALIHLTSDVAKTGLRQMHFFEFFLEKAENQP
jgi:hypothetical protein